MSTLYGDRGFSLIEVMLTVVVSATLLATAVPVITDVSANIKLNAAARTVERELQDARMKSVSANRSLRVRTNCPAAGMLRIVEVLGTDADAPASRCDPAAYRFPADDNMGTIPNYDGPVKLLPAGATVSTVSIQFNPDGTALIVREGVLSPLALPETVSVARGGQSRAITINGVGKIQLQ